MWLNGVLCLSHQQLNDTLALGEKFIRSINIGQLLPPVKEMNIKEDDSSDTYVEQFPKSSLTFS